MYMGDRWSYPRQRSAATYVWQPLTVADGKMSIAAYQEAWSPSTRQSVELQGRMLGRQWQSETIGDSFAIPFKGRRIALYGTTDDKSGYADVIIRDKQGREVFSGTIDFYSLTPSAGIRFLSPVLPKGKYTLEGRVSEMKPNWTDKARNLYGSKGHKAQIADERVVR